MGNYEDLKAAIADVIYQNGNNEITGLLLQQTLLSMVSNLGEYATFAGIATPNTNPGTTDQNVYYLATEAGIYVNFNNIEVNEGEAVILSNKTGEWVKSVSGYSTQESLICNKLDHTNIIDTTNLVHKFSEFEHGTVSEVDGTLSDSTYRIRSKDFVELPLRTNNTPFTFKLKYSENIRVRFIWYDENKAFVGSNDFMINVTPPTNARFVKFVLFPWPDSEFTDEMLAEMQLNIYIPELDSILIYSNLQNLSEQTYDSIIEIGARLPLEYGSLNSSGSEIVTNARVRTKFLNTNVYVQTNDSYLIYELYIYDKATSEYVTSFTINATKYETFIDTDVYTYRLLFRKDDNSNIVNINDVVQDVWAGKFFETRQQIFNISPNNSNILDSYNFFNKNLAGDNTNVRIISDFIPIKQNVNYKLVVPMGYRAEYILYDSRDTIGYESAYMANEIYFNSQNYKWLRVYVREQNDNALTPDIVNNMLLLQYTTKKIDIKVSQWNIGVFDYGLPPVGMPDNQLNIELPKLKSILTELCADIIVINEYNGYINRGDTGIAQLDTYTSLLQQFYPYKFIGSTNLAMFSKYPFVASIKSLSSGRTCIYAIIEIEGIKVGFIAAHATPFSADDRITENNEFVELLAGYDYAIIAGDMNTGNNDESVESQTQQLNVFKDAGFVLSNRGYWGELATYPSTGQSLDNIIVRGFNIDDYKVLSEKSVSDHLPTYAKLNIVI